MSDGKLKFQQVVNEFYLHATHIILNSRICWPLSAKPLPDDKHSLYFRLHTNLSRDVATEINPYILAPMFVYIYMKVPRQTESGVKMESVVVERWNFQFEPYEHGSGFGKPELSSLFKKMIVFVRTLSNSVRLMPTYRLFGYNSRTRNADTQLWYSITGSSSSLSTQTSGPETSGIQSLLSNTYTQIGFEALECVYGKVSLSVSYRMVDEKALETSTRTRSVSQRIIQDYMGGTATSLSPPGGREREREIEMVASSLDASQRRSPHMGGSGTVAQSLPVSTIQNRQRSNTSTSAGKSESSTTSTPVLLKTPDFDSTMSQLITNATATGIRESGRRRHTVSAGNVPSGLSQELGWRAPSSESEDTPKPHSALTESLRTTRPPLHPQSTNSSSSIGGEKHTPEKYVSKLTQVMKESSSNIAAESAAPTLVQPVPVKQGLSTDTSTSTDTPQRKSSPSIPIDTTIKRERGRRDANYSPSSLESSSLKSSLHRSMMGGNSVSARPAFCISSPPTAVSPQQFIDLSSTPPFKPSSLRAGSLMNNSSMVIQGEGSHGQSPTLKLGVRFMKQQSAERSPIVSPSPPTNVHLQKPVQLLPYAPHTGDLLEVFNTDSIASADSSERDSYTPLQRFRSSDSAGSKGVEKSAEIGDSHAARGRKAGSHMPIEMEMFEVDGEKQRDVHTHGSTGSLSDEDAGFLMEPSGSSRHDDHDDLAFALEDLSFGGIDAANPTASNLPSTDSIPVDTAAGRTASEDSLPSRYFSPPNPSLSSRLPTTSISLSLSVHNLRSHSSTHTHTYIHTNTLESFCEFHTGDVRKKVVKEELCRAKVYEEKYRERMP